MQDEQPKKKLKPSTKGLSFLDSLPKPQHNATPPAGTALGAGSAVGGLAGRLDIEQAALLYGNVSHTPGKPAQPAR